MDIVPFPSPTGRELPVEKHFTYLSKYHSIDFLLTTSNQSDFVDHIHRVPKNLFENLLFIKRVKTKKLISFSKEILQKGMMPFDYQYNEHDIERICKIQYDLIWFGAFTTLGLLDLITKHYNGNPKFGISLHDVIYWSYRSALLKYNKYGRRDMQKLLQFIRSYFIKSSESRILKKCDIIHVVSKKERSICLKLINEEERKKVMMVPNGIPKEFLEINPDLNSNILLFFTHLSGGRRWEHKWFFDHVWHIIRAKSDLEVWLVGSPSKQRLKLEGDSRVKVKGFVNDLKIPLSSACMCILPVFHQSGQLNRLFLSMAAGLPLVLTSTAHSTAPELVHCQEVFIANNPEQFAEGVLHIYQSKQLMRDMSVHAKNWIHTKHTWEESSEQFRQFIDSQITRSL